jgi:hypothetical protein
MRQSVDPETFSGWLDAYGRCTEFREWRHRQEE